MSRCFPYACRALGRGSVREGSLPESTKLQKVSEKTPDDSTKDKKGKKVKKERSREGHGKASSSGNTSKKRSYNQSFLSNSKDCCFVAAVDDTCEHLERSSVTEEHFLPSIIPNHYDSDKSQDSVKRLKTAAAAPAPTVSTGSHCRNSFRLRLKLFKPTEADKLSGNATSSSSRAEAALELGATTVPSIYNSAEPSETANVPCFSGRSDVEIERTSQKLALAILRKQRRAKKITRRYEHLVTNWVPPSPLFLDQPRVEDITWLSTCRSPKSSMPTKPFGTNEGAAAADKPVSAFPGSLQPLATYLPEINTFALPYVIPY